jgi:hypothetical protein
MGTSSEARWRRAVEPPIDAPGSNPRFKRTDRRPTHAPSSHDSLNWSSIGVLQASSNPLKPGLPALADLGLAPRYPQT